MREQNNLLTDKDRATVKVQMNIYLLMNNISLRNNKDIIKDMYYLIWLIRHDKP